MLAAMFGVYYFYAVSYSVAIFAYKFWPSLCEEKLPSLDWRSLVPQPFNLLADIATTLGETGDLEGFSVSPRSPMSTSASG